MSMTAACKLIHLVEAFSTPWFLISNQTNHHLVFFLLEMLNNIIQYQFDGNYNLVYTMIRKRTVFHQLANLPTDINKAVNKKAKKPLSRQSSNNVDKSMEGSYPAKTAEPGTLETSLIKLPRIERLTEGVSAHPSQKQLDRLTQALDASSMESRKSFSSEVCPVQPGAEMNQVGEKEETRDVYAKSMLKRSDSNYMAEGWTPTPEWIRSWKNKLPLQTVMRMLQVSSTSGNSLVWFL